MKDKIYWFYYDFDSIPFEELWQIATYVDDELDGKVLFIPKSFDVKLMSKKETLEHLQKMIDYINEKWKDADE